MPQLVQISDLSKRYTPNLFSNKSLLSDSTTISFSQISVGGGYELSEVDSYTGVGSAFRVGLVQNVDTGFQTIFNFGDALTTIVNEQANYLFQMSLKVVLNNGLNLIDLIVTPFINSAPQTPFTITLNVGEMPNNKYVTFSQNINLNVDDEVDFSFEFARDSVGTPNPNATICIDGFKLEKDTYEVGGSGIPSIYTLPLNTENETGFQSRTDETNNQSLLALTDNLVSFSGILEENGGLSLLDSNAKITPIGLNDIVSVDFAFTGVVPIGTNLFLSIYLKVDGNIFRATTLPIIKGVGLDDHFSVSFILPVGADFLANGATIHVNPLVAMTIKNRYVSVTRLAKGV